MNEIEQAISSIRGGNVDAFSIIMDAYHHELFRYAYDLIGHYDTTIDIVQEIFIHLFEKISYFNESKGSFRTWMYQVASRYIYNFFKTDRYRKLVKSVSWDDRLHDIEDEQPTDEMDHVIQVMNRVLNPLEWSILSFYYFQEIPVVEIAQRVKKSEKTVYRIMNQAIKKIQKEVKTND